MSPLPDLPHMNDSATAPSHLPAHHHAEPSELALRLGYAGLIPFVGGSLFIWLLAGRMEPEPFNFLVMAVASYAALVVSFLGGIPCGLIMWQSAAGQALPDKHRRALLTGLAYGAAAWVGMLMPPHAGLVVLGVLLIGCYLNDRKLYPELGASGWLTLRFRLTILSSLSCFLAAAQI
jgi:hypothetical protein